MRYSLFIMVLWGILGFAAGRAACVENSITPKSLNHGEYAFQVSSKSTHGGAAFHVVITATRGPFNRHSSVSLSLKTTISDGAVAIAPVVLQPPIQVHKEGNIWTIDFDASEDLLKNPHAYFILDVPAYVVVDGKEEAMPAADYYEVKLTDFLPF